jgi:hypothetical protein
MFCIVSGHNKVDSLLSKIKEKKVVETDSKAKTEHYMLPQ